MGARCRGKTQIKRPETRLLVPALPLSSHVALSKSPHLSGPLSSPGSPGQRNRCSESLLVPSVLSVPQGYLSPLEQPMTLRVTRQASCLQLYGSVFAPLPEWGKGGVGGPREDHWGQFSSTKGHSKGRGINLTIFAAYRRHMRPKGMSSWGSSRKKKRR